MHNTPWETVRSVTVLYPQVLVQKFIPRTFFGYNITKIETYLP